jgi:hypothetical protein
MTDRLLAEVDALGIEGGISQAEREKQTVALRDQLLALERQEEAVIEAATAAGQEVARRPDADPRVVLGLRIVGAQVRAA